LTDWDRIDPLIALVVAGNIVWTGTRIVRRSVAGLMDTAWPADERERVQQILKIYAKEGVQFHALRTRQAGARRFVSMHVLVPGEWTVQHGHQLLERLEQDIRDALPATTVFTHLEALEDPASFEDQKLERS
jgi:divalent metal cation (Fe/Co/Zn/Cd) transporter